MNYKHHNTFQIFLMHTIFAAGIRIIMYNLGINNAFCQVGGTVSESFVPEFNFEGVKKKRK